MFFRRRPRLAAKRRYGRVPVGDFACAALCLLLFVPSGVASQASSLGSIDAVGGHPVEAMRQMIGAWDVFSDPSASPTGRVTFDWGLGRKTIHKSMSLLVGSDPGPIAEGLIGFNPTSNRIVGIDFQTMLWPENRVVHLMFESEYWVTDNEIRRLYTVHYPSDEPLMPILEAGGVTRQYRETYSFADDGTVRWVNHILDHGEWKAFGPNPDGSLLRPAGSQGVES